jgi:hypothetical protein
VAFDEHDRRTPLTVQQRLETVVDREAYGKMGAAEGRGQLGRLDALRAEGEKGAQA